MSDLELREAVAVRVMGHKIGKIGKIGKRDVYRKRADSDEYMARGPVMCIIHKGWNQKLPAYESDIAAAWLVVEAMRDEYYFEMARGRDGYTYAMFQPYGTGDSQISEATAPTAPLAICRAALAAIEATQ